ncbi:hypothetical protein CIT25_02295 [Mesorhizobium mediterraneum]|uniref:Uncharacterized protein n=1 Tax=Mesorhizobium mediterraneum TaxID=43617 RepID=A0AB36RH46_9HYPH|nr:hypothetical protein CIT25_02295 [Mesorhizobium mediterraneum]
MAALEEIRAGRVYDCRPDRGSGQEHPPPLIRSLLATGLARTDRLHLDIATDGALINRDGRHSDLLYVLAPYTMSASIR